MGGKLLRKFLHSLLPSSWVTKMKVTDGSTRKLLTLFRAAPSSKSVSTSQKSSGSPSAELRSVVGGRSSSYDGASAGAMDLVTTTELSISSSSHDGISRGAMGQESELAERREAERDDGRAMGKELGMVVRYGSRKRKREWVEEWRGRSSSSHRWSWKRAKRAGISAELPDCLCEVVGDSRAVVKYVEDPDEELWESMVEMIVGNGLWELQNLECLLYCYLSLNDPSLHYTIERTFLRVLTDLDGTS